MKKITVALIGVSFALAGCTFNTSQPKPNRLAIYDNASGDACPFSSGYAPGGVIEWEPAPDWKGRTFEGYPTFLGENATYEARVTGLRLVRIPSTHPAFPRFAKALTDKAADCQMVALDVTVDKSGGRDGVIAVACLSPRSDYMVIGQRVVFRSYGTHEAGFTRVVLAAPARYAEKYPLSFAPNAEYTAIVTGTAPVVLTRSDSAYSRVVETGGRLPLGSVDCQMVCMRVQADTREVYTEIFMPRFPVWRKGDIVTYRTFGNPTNGFADIEIVQPAGTGAQPRSPEDSTTQWWR